MENALYDFRWSNLYIFLVLKVCDSGNANEACPDVWFGSSYRALSPYVSFNSLKSVRFVQFARLASN